MTEHKSVAGIVLAAGDGKRLKSELPKVLHRAAGRSLLGHVVAALRPLDLEARVIVTSPRQDEFEHSLAGEGLDEGISFAVQETPKGTADALRVAVDSLSANVDFVLVVPGDSPLLTTDTLASLVGAQRDGASAAMMLTATLDDPTGYGRVVRSPDGSVDRIVEDRDASEEELAIHEVNAGVYVFDFNLLSKLLPKVDRENAQSEFYLTDIVGLLRSDGETVEAVRVEADEVVGVNTRVDLAVATGLLRRRVNEHWMAEGVTIMDPDSTYIDATAEIRRDATILPSTLIEGTSSIGEGATVGPQTRVIDSKIGPRATVTYAVVRDSEVGPDASIGPFASLRSETIVGKGARLGTFVEAKNSSIGDETKANHLAYLGDATIGRDVNVGAGTITCNWDGTTKHETVIEDDAYIGSDTMLIAPTRIGKRAATGAGAVVKGDVPDDALAVGVPAKVLPNKGNKMKRPARDENPGDESREPRQ